MATVSDLSATGKLFIPDFCLAWILAMEGHLLYTGRTEALLDVLPAAVRALQWFLDFIDEDGLLADLPGWSFIDWSTELDRNGEVTVLNAMYVAAIRAICTVARHLGLESLTQGLLPVAETVADAINRHLYDPVRHLYADSRKDSALSSRFSQHANSAVIAFDIAPATRHAAICRAISDPERLNLSRAWAADDERPFDPETQIIMAQPFFSHYVHIAYARSGNLDAMLTSIRDRWLPMVRRNGTVWEHWQDTPVTSLCHAFSCTPLYDLPTHIVGIRPTGFGFSEFRVRPRLGDLQWARATMPTPHGDISVRWDASDDGFFSLELTVPSHTTAVVELPDGYIGSTRFGPGVHKTRYQHAE
jgi:alpha-L-rhamnosidase